MRVIHQDEDLLRVHETNNAANLMQALEFLAGSGAKVYIGLRCKDYDCVFSIPWINNYFEGLVAKLHLIKRKWRKSILTAEPKAFDNIVQYEEKFLADRGLSVTDRSGDAHVLHDFCKKIFDYKQLFSGKVLRFDSVGRRLYWEPPDEGQESFDGWRYFESLHYQVCPYCNKNVLNINRNYPRPEFDHFYEYSAYPVLGISLYNLIPVCEICNQNAKKVKFASGVVKWNPFVSPDFHKAMVIDCQITDYKLSAAEDVQLWLKPRGSAGRMLPGGVDFLEYYHVEYSDAACERLRHLGWASNAMKRYYRLYFKRYNSRSVAADMRCIFNREFSEDDINNRAFLKLTLDLTSHSPKPPSELWLSILYNRVRRLFSRRNP